MSKQRATETKTRVNGTTVQKARAESGATIPGVRPALPSSHHIRLLTLCKVALTARPLRRLSQTSPFDVAYSRLTCSLAARPPGARDRTPICTS